MRDPAPDGGGAGAGAGQRWGGVGWRRGRGRASTMAGGPAPTAGLSAGAGQRKGGRGWGGRGRRRRWRRRRRRLRRRRRRRGRQAGRKGRGGAGAAPLKNRSDTPKPPAKKIKRGGGTRASAASRQDPRLRKEGGRRLGARRRSWTAGEPALGPDGGRVGGGGGGEGIYDSGGAGTYGGAQHRSRTAGGSGGAEGG